MSEAKRRSYAWSSALAGWLFSLCGAAQAANPAAPECLAASSSAIRADNEHRFRAERAELLVCASASCPADIRKECIRRVDEVSAAIPTIVFEAKDDAGNDLSAVKVTMDSEVLTERLEGMALSIDPGVHTFTFEAAGFPSIQKHLVIRERQRDRSERVIFEAPPPPPASVSPSKPALTRPSTPSAAPAEEPSRTGTTKAFTILATGVGVAGLAAGTVFGLQAKSKRDEATKLCPSTCADSAGVTRWHDAKTAGNLSTIGFIVGGAGLAGATVIWLAGKPESASAPAAQVGFGPGSISVRGRW